MSLNQPHKKHRVSVETTLDVLMNLHKLNVCNRLKVAFNSIIIHVGFVVKVMVSSYNKKLAININSPD